MAWGLNLADLKQFAWNSIQYSSLPDNRKIEGFQKWKNEWNLFVDYSYKLACNQTFPNITMNISDIFPSYGPYNQSINITIFGSGFEIAICKQIICKFDEKQTNGIFVDLNEIICPTPSINTNMLTVSVSLLIDNEIFESGISYKFVSPFSIIDDGILLTNNPSKTDQRVIINQQLIINLLILLFSIKTLF